jgi:predicted lipoprotein with Yx(FWY)xxD motif
LLAGVAFSACGGSSTTVQNTSGENAPHLEGGPSYEVKLANVHGLGPILVNGQGLTLYLFIPDHQSGSTCYDVCALQWPPVTLPPGVTAPVAGPGIHASLLGTSPRSDGTVQVTYSGWPLYRWTPDTAPGQATGQGLNNLGGLWWVVNSSGDAVTS